MKKQFLILGFVISLVLVSSFVSAGLCRGNDGYYHDCDDFYYKEGYKVYETERYYDKEKYSSYNDYRNWFGPNYYVKYYKKDYQYRFDKEDGRTYYVYEGGKNKKKSRTYYEIKKVYDKDYVRGYKKGYGKGYRDGYDYGYYSGDRGYGKGYRYYENYDNRVRDVPSKIIYVATGRGGCKSEWVC